MLSTIIFLSILESHVVTSPYFSWCAISWIIYCDTKMEWLFPGLVSTVDAWYLACSITMAINIGRDANENGWTKCCVVWFMQIYIMDSQYENGNVTDFDVVRSTQFVEDFQRGVCVDSIPFWVVCWVNFAKPSSSIDCMTRTFFHVCS